jgi:hypothetical protein
MLDEFEIVCWTRFIDNFNLLEHTYSAYESKSALDCALWFAFYIAVATKSVLNDDASLKDVIHCFIVN